MLNSILCSHSNSDSHTRALNSQLATLCYRVSHLIYYVSRIHLQLDKYEWGGGKRKSCGGKIRENLTTFRHRSRVKVD